MKFTHSVALAILPTLATLAFSPSTRAADTLPAPYATKSRKNFSHVKGWPEGKTPIAPEGFVVTAFARDLKHPRNIYVAPDGQVFVSEADRGQSTQQITLFRNFDAQGMPREHSTFLAKLNQPYGVTIIGNSFYVANQDGVWRYPYQATDSEMKAPGQKILELPTGGYNNHWTRNLLASADGKKIYVTVGSGSNAGEHGMKNEIRRANILEINPDGSGEKIYASGLRNPVGIAFKPGTSTLYTVVNERDELGDDLVPDYFTHVEEGGFYGWPYSYFGQHLDPRVQDPKLELVKRAIVPDVPLGSHTASLGLAFYATGPFPDRFHDGVFIGQHGSWNRSQLAGYQVAFLSMRESKQARKPEPFLTGFIADAEKKRSLRTARGRRGDERRLPPRRGRRW